MSALALVVQNLGRYVPVLVSALYQTEGKVDILAIHEEIFVELPHSIQRLMAQHAERSADNLNLGRLVPRQVAHIIACEAVAFGVACAESAHLVEGCHRCRHAAARLHSLLTVVLEHHYAGSSGLLVCIHELQHVAYGVLAYDGVGIEQKHILARALLYGNVVGARETEVAVAADDVHVRELLREILHASVVRMIVNYIHFGLYTVDSSEQRVQTLLDIETHFIADYNDR